MSIFRVNVEAVNVADQQRVSPLIQALVGSDSELNWLPADVLKAIGIAPERTRAFKTATGPTPRRLRNSAGGRRRND